MKKMLWLGGISLAALLALVPAAAADESARGARNVTEHGHGRYGWRPPPPPPPPPRPYWGGGGVWFGYGPRPYRYAPPPPRYYYYPPRPYYYYYPGGRVYYYARP